MYNIIIAGSRNFNDYNFLRKKMNNLLRNILMDYTSDIFIISGTAPGADTLGEKYAHNKGLPIIRMPANWRPNGVYDNAAGYKRNEEMAKVATHCVVFWDGESRGSKHMIDLAKKYELNLRVYHV